MTIEPTAARSDAVSSGAGPLGRAGWVLFDWAYQPFLALGAFVFAPYLSAELVGDPARGQALWGYMLGAVGLVVAFSSPVLGAIADAVGRRKPWVLVFSLLTVVAATALFLAEPGTPHAVLLALVLFGLAAVGAELATVFNNAMLPSLVPQERMGRLSGLGWGAGYAGGLVALTIVLLGAVLPETPLVPLDRTRFEVERMVGPFSALWLAVFLIPFFWFTPDAPARRVPVGRAVAEGLDRLKRTAQRARELANVGRFLLARMLYQDGLSALMNFAGLYGAGVFGWSITTLGLFAIILIVAAVPGSLLGGLLDDRIGPKRTIVLAVAGLIVAAIGVLSVRPDAVLFVIPVAPADPEGGPFSGTAERVFLAFGLLAGLCVGPAQAASRTLMAHLAPPGMVTEFFGLYAFAGKATAFVAPLLIGVVTGLTGSQRPAIVVLVVLLGLGLALLLTVRQTRSTVRPVL